MSQSFPLDFILNVKNNMSAGINQATGDIQKLGNTADDTGKKATKSGMSMGEAFQFTALNAFNLASSLISTKRSYEDLGKAENAQINKRDAVTKATNRLENAESNLKSARKKGDPEKIAKAERALENARLGVDKATRAEKLGQTELNRSYEDFYLSIIPNVISGIGTVAGVIQTLRGVTITAGGALKTFVLPLAAISAVFTAIATDFLGFRTFLEDLGKSIGDAIPALRPFLELLQAVGFALGLTETDKNLNTAVANMRRSIQPLIDGFKSLIDVIMKGDWNTAFTIVKKAALDMWAALKEQVPLFGGAEKLAGLISQGDWKGAWSFLSTSINDWWNTSGKPTLTAIGNQLVTALYPEKTKTELAALPIQLQAQWNLFKDAIKNGDWAGAFGAVKAAYDVAAPQWLKDLLAWGNKMVLSMIEGMKAGLTQISVQFIDPFIASLFDPATWQAAATKSAALFLQIGTTIVNLIVGAFKDPKAIGTAASEFGSNLLGGIQSWFETNLPKTTKAFSGMISGITAVATDAVVAFIEVFTKGIPGAISHSASEITKNFANMGKLSSGGILSGLTPFGAWMFGQPGGVTPQAAQIPAPDISKVTSAVNAAQTKINSLRGKSVELVTTHIDKYKKVYVAKGFSGLVTTPTEFVAGEKGPEHVQVTPLTGSSARQTTSTLRAGVSARGGGGGGPIVVQTFLDGRMIAESVAKRMSQPQGAYK